VSVVYIDALDVSVADSWVVPSNKTGTGNGEAKIYVGQRPSRSYKEFFGPTGYRLQCRFRKSDLLRFLDEMKVEYWYPTYPYRHRQNFRELWVERRAFIEGFSDEFIYFNVDEQSQLEGPRGYINSEDQNYQILRLLPLPDTSILKIVKLQDDGETYFEFRLMPDFDGSTHRSVEDEIQMSTDEDDIRRASELVPPPATTVERIVKARVGQQKFKKEVIKQCDGTCAFTLVHDEGLLIAGHIKPWAKSNDEEKLDPQNGLVFTPTYDRLFNNGLITFTDSRALLISPLVSRETATRLHIAPNMEIDIPLLGNSNRRRRDYMDYHREHEFRR
jgi:putative restriction endonuclease